MRPRSRAWIESNPEVATLFRRKTFTPDERERIADWCLSVIGPVLLTSPEPLMRTNVPSPRQVEILQLLAEGLTTDEIGKRLFVSPHTIKTMRETALQRLGARNTAEAVAIAFRRGLIS